MFRRIYLDNSATTAVSPEVLEAMLPYLRENYGNASSIHHFGQQARAAVDRARHQVAAALNARPNEIVFTSGGTESNNLAIRGILESRVGAGVSSPTVREGANDKGNIIISSIEHPSVENVCDDLKSSGYGITQLPVYENGIVRIEDLKSALRDDTILISVMAANNEIGTLQPVEAIGKLAREIRAAGKKIWFHTDAVQAFGKIKVDVEEFGCDLLSISAHKIHAPKGIGALYVRRGVRLHSQNLGGHQERERRGGTENVAGIVALGKASEISEANRDANSRRIKILRDEFESAVGERFPDAVFNGDRNSRLPNISNISFRQIEGEGLLINLDMQGVAVSTGSACSSGSLEPSPVIRALGREDELARGAIRFSFGKFNTKEDVKDVLEILPRAVESLRQMSPKATSRAK